MLLAEALVLRADLQKRQGLLRRRLKQCLIVQEGDKPPEDPAKLLRRVREESAELYRLVAAINRTNETNKVDTKDGTLSITEALAQREHMQNMTGLLRDLAERSNPSKQYSRSEIRSVAVMDAAKLQAEADTVARDLRQLIMTLQKVDWSVTVEDYEPSDVAVDLTPS